MNTFKCIACGKCCSRIRGNIGADDKDFIRENAYGKMPLVQLVPMERVSFPLWDWEAKRFMVWEKEVKIDAKIKPSRAAFDLNSNRTIIVTYFMDSDSCPFLMDGGKCKIYDKKRAYVCRLYPMQSTPFLETGDNLGARDMVGNCEVALKDIGGAPEDKKGMTRWLSTYFSDGSFENAVQNDIVTEWVNRTVIGLMKDKVIRPAMNYPYDKLLKRIENSEKIPLTEFLVEQNIKTRKQIDILIEGFDNNIDARSKIKEFLG